MAESDQKHFQLWGQRPAEAAEIPKETEHSLLEWAGWPKKKRGKTVEIQETSLEQAILDKRADAHPPVQADPQAPAAVPAPPAAVPAPQAPLAPAAPAPDAPAAPEQA